MVYRLYVEKKQEYDVLTDKIRADILQLLGIDLKYFRRLLRYDVEGLSGAALELAKTSIFSEPPVDVIYENEQSFEGKRVLVVEYLDGQFDQRADSAEQCVQLLTAGVRPLVRCATVYLFDGIADSVQYDFGFGFFFTGGAADGGLSRFALSVDADQQVFVFLYNHIVFDSFCIF